MQDWHEKFNCNDHTSACVAQHNHMCISVLKVIKLIQEHLWQTDRSLWFPIGSVYVSYLKH